jgi:hypothetical protein
MAQVIVSAFSATTQLSGGHKGLDKRKTYKSSATIAGTNLADGLPADVRHPQQSQNPTLQWTGRTANTSADGTSCTVELTQQKDLKGQSSGPRDDATSVSVTVGDSNALNTNTYTGTT